MTDVATEKRELVEVINEIDANTITVGRVKFGDLWAVEQKGMWLKGRAVLEYYPELEDQAHEPSKGGRPSKTMKSVHSFSSVAREIGRSNHSVIKWVNLVLTVGSSEKKFLAWVKQAKVAVQEKWQQRLLTRDNERKEPEPKPTQVYNATLASVEEKVNNRDIDWPDIDYLLEQVKLLREALHNILMALDDENVDKARKEIQKALEE